MLISQGSPLAAIKVLWRYGAGKVFTLKEAKDIVESIQAERAKRKDAQ